MRWIIAIVVVGLSTANAAPGDGIVVESYAGQRPEDANRLLSPVLDELANRGYVAGPEVVGRRFEQRVSRSSIVDGLVADVFEAQVEKGHKAWIGGRFDEAVKLLTPLVDAAHANAGAFASNQPLRDKLLKALIALALSQQRIGVQDATRAAFGEILRSFPGTQLSRATYGPDAFNLFEDVKKSTLASGKAKLVVKATNEAAVVFINERLVATGGSATESVLPGEYRVFVQVGKQLSRVHYVTLRAGDEQQVGIDTDFDNAVHTSPTWTGLQFGDAAAQAKLQGEYAAGFANGINAHGVVMIGIDTIAGKRAVVGSLVSLMNGREVRRGSIPLDPDPSAETLRNLGKFLAGDNVAPGVIVHRAGDLASADKGNGGERVVIGDGSPQSDDGGGRMWGGWKWITGGAGLAALGVGAYLLSVDGDCTDDPCTYQRSTQVPGWITLGGGAVLTGISVYLFVRGRGESSSQRSAFIVPARGGAYAGYALKF